MADPSKRSVMRELLKEELAQKEELAEETKKFPKIVKGKENSKQISGELLKKEIAEKEETDKFPKRGKGKENSEDERISGLNEQIPIIGLRHDRLEKLFNLHIDDDPQQGDDPDNPFQWEPLDDPDNPVHLIAPTADLGQLDGYLENSGGIDRKRPLRVLVLMQSIDDCNNIKYVFEEISKHYCQHLSVVCFTRLHDAMIHMNLDYTLMTQKYNYAGGVNGVEAVTHEFIRRPLGQPVPLVPPIPDIIVVDDVTQRHPDFQRWIQTVFSGLKLIVLTADQGLALRHAADLDPPFHGPAQRPFSSSRWRRMRRVEDPPDEVHALMWNEAREFVYDICEMIEFGDIDLQPLDLAHLGEVMM